MGLRNANCIFLGSVLSTFLNGGSPVESDSADAEDDVEADEDEDLELEEGSQAYSGPFFEGAKIMADGPRYGFDLT